jgi:hypothetical protein
MAGLFTPMKKKCSSARLQYKWRQVGRLILERFVTAPSLGLLLRPGLVPRPVQLLRKALLVDSAVRALGYLGWYAKARRLSGG